MIGKDILKAADLLKQGFVVGIPTETVYGLAANALNENAVLSVFEIKNRPQFDPLIIHLPNFEAVEKYTVNIPPKAYLLANKFMPGPLTLLLYKNDSIPFLVTSGSDKVAVRIPQHSLTLELLKNLDFPLAAPSANPFGYISPTKAEHVEKQLGEKIHYILDGGDSAIGIESTIVDCTTEPFTILRLGGISFDVLEDCLGEKININITSNSNPQAPGQLDKHYSPRTPLLLLDEIENYPFNEKQIAVINFGNHPIPEDVLSINLSLSGDDKEAAKNLFHSMRELDEAKVELIIAQKLPEKGLGAAINDRLKRASVKN
jgi:L-threonylcarbamoyladenylate synthase